MISRTSQSDNLLLVMENRKNHQSFSQLATRAPDSIRIFHSNLASCSAGVPPEELVQTERSPDPVTTPSSHSWLHHPFS
eukprot:1269064-Pleurochrysis_carterae.AAC.1